jgi:hypothetical protein
VGACLAVRAWDCDSRSILHIEDIDQIKVACTHSCDTVCFALKRAEYVVSINVEIYRASILYGWLS